MRLGEKLLLFLSRNPGSPDYKMRGQAWDLDNALSLLCRVFPDFMENIIGKEILDFGCGCGWQAVMLAKNGAKYVLGIDINETELERAKQLARRLCLGNRVEFSDKLDNRSRHRFDIAVSQNSMEHFGDPIDVLIQMKSALKRGGEMLITFGAPWFSPRGSHMHFFTKMPWVNMLFSERTVMSVRGRFRRDGATKYEEVESGLNRMTVAKFERLTAACGLRIHYKRYDCVKGVNFVGKLPSFRELFINRVSCVLRGHERATYRLADSRGS